MPASDADNEEYDADRAERGRRNRSGNGASGGRGPSEAARSGHGPGSGDDADVTAAQAIRNAGEQLSALLGRAPESVSALTRNDEGWTADVEVVEMERIPDSTSVMATYSVQLDHGGELIGYERRRRYPRGQVDHP